ncbi:MAG TPA: hypothetical protein VG944_20120 [Fimbriimonas sp.]|nr:hypothetical protein [Fimbriimonas sp.]
MSSDKSNLFEFDGAACLYRDHNGDRVLADIEGAGLYNVQFRSESLRVIVDDSPTDRFEGSYDHSLTVTSAENGISRVAVGRCRADQLNGPIQQGQEFAGSGWIVEAKHIHEVDGEHRGFETIPEPFAMPFFLGVKGESLRIVQEGDPWLSIDSFDVWNLDALKERGWSVQNSSALFDLDSRFPDGTPLVSHVLSHLNAATFRLKLPRGCRGLILRKRYDAFHGRQRARVLIDGKFAGWWYEAAQDRQNRWRWARFGVPAELVEEKTEIRVTIDPPAGSPLWSVSGYEVLAKVAPG